MPHWKSHSARFFADFALHALFAFCVFFESSLVCCFMQRTAALAEADRVTAAKAAELAAKEKVALLLLLTTSCLLMVISSVIAS